MKFWKDIDYKEEWNETENLPIHRPVLIKNSFCICSHVTMYILLKNSWMKYNYWLFCRLPFYGLFIRVSLVEQWQLCNDYSHLNYYFNLHLCPCTFQCLFVLVSLQCFITSLAPKRTASIVGPRIVPTYRQIWAEYNLHHYFNLPFGAWHTSSFVPSSRCLIRPLLQLPYAGGARIPSWS